MDEEMENVDICRMYEKSNSAFIQILLDFIIY